MIHNYINASKIVGEIYDNFNIKSHAWESKAPMWMFHALGKIGINKFTFDQDPILINIISHRFQIPDEATLIKKIHFFEEEPDLLDYAKSVISGQIITPFIQRGLWIYVDEIETGYALVKYKSFPAEEDSNSRQIFPVIPDDEYLLDYLRFYVLMQILMTGYIHPVYNLSVNNPWVNPQMMLLQKIKFARNSVSRMDPIDQHKVSSMISTFITPRLTPSFFINDVNR